MDSAPETDQAKIALLPLLNQDARALGASMNECMQCWEAILPNTVRHPTIKIDLWRFCSYYQSRYAGAMYSGCGGGYLLCRL